SSIAVADPIASCFRAGPMGISWNAPRHFINDETPGFRREELTVSRLGRRRSLHLERIALNDELHHVLETVTLGPGFGDDVIHVRSIGGPQCAAQGVREQLLGQAARELIDPRSQERLQSRDARELPAVRELSRGIDRSGTLVARPAIAVAPGADRIEILQRKTRGIDLAMTFGATGQAP